MKPQIWKIMFMSAILRILPIIILGNYQKIQQGELYGTDIDYKVYSDSTKYSNPYERHTFRYTPILSYLMAYNYSVNQIIGKLVFVFFDIIAIYFLWNIVAKNASMQKQEKQSAKIIKNANFIAKLYGYNPLFIYLTTRGSCQSISMALMYAFWYFFIGKNVSGNQTPQDLQKNKIQTLQVSSVHKAISYLIYGIWVHFRIYPIIFLPLLIIYEYKNCRYQSIKDVISRTITFGVIAGGTFIALFLVFYQLYGQSFMNESFLYHFIRKDNRHSFSPFFYDIYLNYADSKPTRQLPAILMIFVLTSNFSKQLSLYYLQFLMTFAFVEFNSVITLQYYMWVWGSLLILLPQSRIITFGLHRKGFNLALQWLLGICLWVWMSMKVENDGENILTAMWVICIIKIGIDLWVLLGLIKTIKPQSAQQLRRIKLQQSKSILMGQRKSKRD